MNIAVIFAGGVGTRMHSKDVPKQFLLIHEKPIIVHTLELFNNHDEIDAIVIACVPDWIEHLERLTIKFGLTKVKSIVPGGKSSQESIFHGLEAAERLDPSEDTIVLIHDGVRPLITPKTISDNIRGVRQNGSAITSISVKETVLIVDKKEKIVEVPSRSDSRLARAPQSFYLKDIVTAHRKAIDEGKDNFIDCCSMMKYYGKELYLVEGPQENIKITTPDDFYSMRAILDARENAQIYGLEN